MSNKINPSRRHFLRAASMLSVAGSVVTPFALNLAAIGSAAASTAGDYKALVCLFMNGGNDQANTVLATDSDSWKDYINIRTTNEAGSIALPAAGKAGGVLPITPVTAQPGRSFALHPNLGSLRDLFDSGRAAIVANVGALAAPTTLAEYKAASVALPPKLFSHNDQQSIWQSFHPEGAATGWGGRMGDLLASGNAHPIFTCISTSGNAVFLSGENITQYQVSPNGGVPIGSLAGTVLGAPINPLQAIITGDHANLFEKSYAQVVQRSISAQNLLTPALLPAGAGGVPNPTQYINPNTKTMADNSLATQLQMVARIIGGHTALGTQRQVFFVNINGFDTHDYQQANHGDLMARLAHALAYFDHALSSLGGSDMRDQVTLFTASEFGRTFTSNGDGTDHGWGSHHFVVGGAVKGKNIYGTFPVTGLGHSQDVGLGSLLPSISIEQYGATLASWFGLSASQISDVFPNLVNFSTKNLGFMS